MTNGTVLTNRVAPADLATEEDLDDCYRLLLGREPDSEGRATWEARLREHPTTVSELVRSFVRSQEFLRKHGLAPDQSGSARTGAEDRPLPRSWKLMRALIARSKEHAFLDRAWIGWLLRLTPPRLRRSLALRLLSLSPHYWVYQWSSRYPVEYRREAVLEHEFRRNARSREEICEKLLRKFVRPTDSVLDFGCGPGFLARAISPYAAKVVGADVSRGVVACARQLNPASNLSYVANRPSDLAAVPSGSMDLIYSFAVFQHLRREQTECFLREFVRILKPGGRGLYHTILKVPGVDQYTGESDSGKWLEKDISLRMVYLTDEEHRSLLGRLGFVNIAIEPISKLCQIDDDIGNEHLVRFEKP